MLDPIRLLTGGRVTPIELMFRNSSAQERLRHRIAYVPLPGDGKPHTVTLIPGDGIGPEVTSSVVDAVAALGAPITWER